jgi:tetratricopeptide (TPR) repeat protein
MAIGCAGSNFSRGWDHLSKENYTAAISEFDTAATIKENPQLYFGYFQAYMGIHDFENAKKYLTIGIGKYPEDAWLNLCAGHWYMLRGNDPQKALYYYELAGKLRFANPTNTMHKTMDKYIAQAKAKIILDSLDSLSSENIETPK